MYDIVGSDARLARIIQEQERLEALRRAEERRIRRQERERQVLKFPTIYDISPIVVVFA